MVNQKKFSSTTKSIKILLKRKIFTIISCLNFDHGHTRTEKLKALIW